METTTVATVEERLQRLEAADAIRTLIARYCYAMDNRDLAAVVDLFTPDVVVRSHDGVMDSRGRDAVMAMFQERWSVLGPSFHWTHDVIVDVADGSRDATGLVSCHAEVTRSGRAQLSAIRYSDRYRREDDGRWRFSERTLSFFYYLDPREYAEVLEHPLRIRTYGDPAVAGFPEQVESYRRYYEEHPR